MTVPVASMKQRPCAPLILGLKDEYSESDLEESLIRHLKAFLLELGGDFYFIARRSRDSTAKRCAFHSTMMNTRSSS